MQLPYRFGRYELTEKLASGGMAEIYRATYTGEGGFEKTVAVKRLLPAWSSNKEFVAMLIDEAKAQAKLSHPNIVQVIELGKEGESYFISMELVDGVDLGRLSNKILRENIRFPLKFIIYIVTQVLGALDFAHNQRGPDEKPLNIVHRDISPPNVLCSWNGEVKVADFGIAKGAHRTYETAAAQLKGKYSYMSPEQARGEKIDSRTDIYAAGILLFELLTGRRLFDAPNDLEVIELVKKSKIPFGLLQIIDNDLKKILLCALCADKNKRYQCAKDFMADLTSYALKNNLLTTSFEFGRFLLEIFPAEERMNRKESKKSAEESGKTKPIPASVKFSMRLERIKYLPFLRGATILTLLFCIFLPGTALNGKGASPPQLTIAPAAAPLNEKDNAAASEDKDETGEKPAFISVQANPWGYVTIPGSVYRKETPVQNLKLKPGTYIVRVFHEPTNQRLEKRIDVKVESRTKCLARFGKNPSLSCK
jgi:serine/threonine protein kinase